MGFSAHSAGVRLSLPPPVLAILWLDAVLVAAGALSLAGNPLLLARALPGWTGLAFVGAGLTAATAALAAFMLAMERRSAWAWLPVPALALWLTASGVDSLALGDGRSHLWGDKLDEAGLCLGFLLAAAAPLFALIVFMLRRAAPRARSLAMALGGLASVGAAASLLALVHPHQAPLLDLAVHALALIVIFVLGALAALVSTRLARA
jgi:hypothetical protein